MPPYLKATAKKGKKHVPKCFHFCDQKESWPSLAKENSETNFNLNQNPVKVLQLSTRKLIATQKEMEELIDLKNFEKAANLKLAENAAAFIDR